MTCVKICGLTNVHDALLSAAAGADLLGLIFYPPSPRYVTPTQAGRIVEAVRRTALPACTVGVFVDEELARVRQTLSVCGLDYAQLHGAEPPGATAALLGSGYNVIKAFRVREGFVPEELAAYRATAYLLDTYVPGQPGGTGQAFDWNLAARARIYGPVILAGGLTPDNVGQAIRTARPWGVDVSSGVEREPGHKDADQVRRFIAAAKA